MSKIASLRTSKFLAAWLPIAIVCVGLSLLVAGAVQQNYRQSANDPQVQMTEDTAAALNSGTSAATLVPRQRVDMEHSLAPFIIIVDKQQRIVASDADAGPDSQLPPSGVFGNAAAHGEQRVTWQTAHGVRFAAVVVSTDSGYVVAARSLREVEAREDALRTLWAAVLTGLLVATAVAVLAFR